MGAVRLLLGPAGSGKTHRCLAEIRDALKAEPEGAPLILLAPKQATFQLERQLLEDPPPGETPLHGYTRLQILSFDRLATFVIEALGAPSLRLLSEEGRLMVLRALLAREESRLEMFRPAARLPGFASRLSQTLRELQRQQIGPHRLTHLAADAAAPHSLAAKLRDMALILRAYEERLEQRAMEDPDRLADLAVEAIRAASRGPTPSLHFAGLWLDGFAEMTNQELALLVALLPHCANATLAFCLDGVPGPGTGWLSTWSLVTQTVRDCRQRLAAVDSLNVSVEVLPRGNVMGRFKAGTALAHLEASWAMPGTSQRHPLSAPLSLPMREGCEEGRVSSDQVDPAEAPRAPVGFHTAIQLFQAPTPEAEAAHVARVILEHARMGFRYREMAVIVRDLGTCAPVLRRTFSRFEIPFFLDQRESVNHHPLAELTRHALRVVAFGWQHEDWFGALKSGLVPVQEEWLDELENQALANGWAGRDWHQPLRGKPEALPVPTPSSGPDDGAPAKEPSRNAVATLEQLRQTLVPPFLALGRALSAKVPLPHEPASGDGGDASPLTQEPLKSQHPCSGSTLAAALRSFWGTLEVAATLERWSADPAGTDATARRHLTVWEQMQAWADNLALAFADDVLPLREWLPILEAGLSALTVGVVPPALDQVLVGAVDRSRNSELRLAIVMGLNEGRFPAPPPGPTMLTEAESAALERQGVFLGARARLRIAHERYYGYIAFTRSAERIVGTFPLADSEGRALNPSPFVGHLQRMFPGLACQATPPWNDWRSALHIHELAAEWLRPGSALNTLDRDAEGRLLDDSPFKPLAQRLDDLRNFREQPELSSAVAARLYGNPLRLSVSSLEQFGMCPFRFFVRAGMRAEERQLFETDPRELGNFQHEVLSAFHEQLRAEGLRWRDITPAQARERIGIIAPTIARILRGGLFEKGAANQFTCRALTEALQEFVAAIVGWMPQYSLDPTEAELGFGGNPPDLPAWVLDLDGTHQLAFRGRIDRVDVSPPLDDGTRWVAVHDYKSSGRQFDPELLANGIQLQLPAYLAVLRGIQGATTRLGASSLRPAGVFYVNLRGDYPGVAQREDALQDPDGARRRAYRHIGRFDAAAIPVLDTRGGRQGDQFNYEIRQDGGLSRRRKDPMPSAEFESMLCNVEDQLRAMGRRVIAGRVDVDPYARGSERPCDLCEFAGICRINPWTHRFRALGAPDAPPPSA